DEALEIFEESKGSHFEPCIADAVIHCRDIIIAEDLKFKQDEEDRNKREIEWWVSYHEQLKRLGIN
ncbi:MAG: hypothetical protein K5839_02260, partial [Treponemataceae bacterium]|nr:hypothetical protein [Treponemataceae bacterium]